MEAKVSGARPPGGAGGIAASQGLATPPGTHECSGGPLPFGRLYARPRQLHLLLRWRPSSGDLVNPTLVLPLVRPHLLRCTDLFWLASGVPLYSPSPRLSICSDPSPSGWGHTLPEFVTALGRWPRELTLQLVAVEGRGACPQRLAGASSASGDPGPLRQRDGCGLHPEPGRHAPALAVRPPVPSPAMVQRPRLGGCRSEQG